MTIPKRIHYCWFGGNIMPEVVQLCIQSWQDKLPDYELMRWDETNTDLNHPFVKKAYEDKKWAFVADFVRLEKLLEFGGIYLDTDMLVLKDFSDLLHNACFVGLESERYISCGVIGAEANHPYIKNCLNYYTHFKNHQVIDYKAFVIPKIFTKVYKEQYSQVVDTLTPQVFPDLSILEVNYFYAYPNPDPNKKRQANDYKQFITDTSYAVHLWDRSWKGFNEFQLLRQGQYAKGFKKSMSEFFKHPDKRRFSYFRELASSIKFSLKNI